MSNTAVTATKAPINNTRLRPTKASDSVFKGRRYKCALADVATKDIDYKNLQLLTQFISKRGRIMSVRVTNVSSYKQRLLAQAIKRARFLGLMPYLKRPSNSNIS